MAAQVSPKTTPRIPTTGLARPAMFVVGENGMSVVGRGTMIVVVMVVTVVVAVTVDVQSVKDSKICIAGIGPKVTTGLFVSMLISTAFEAAGAREEILSLPPNVD